MTAAQQPTCDVPEPGLAELLDRLDRALGAPAEVAAARSDEASRLLGRLAQAAREVGRPDAADFADLLAAVVEIADCAGAPQGSQGEERGAERAEASIVRSGLDLLRAALDGDPGAALQIAQVEEEARRTWGDHLELVYREPGADEAIFQFEDAGRAAESLDELGAEALASRELERALASLVETAPAQPSGSPDALRQQSRPGARIASGKAGVTDAPVPRSPSRHVGEGWGGVAIERAGARLPTLPDADVLSAEVERELLAAYLDDAGRCMASMEQCLLALEADPADREAVAQLCRDLHTLKGASGTVDLPNLARYLHDLETYLQARQAEGAAIEIDGLLRGLDAVRERIAALVTGPSANGWGSEVQGPGRVLAFESNTGRILSPEPRTASADTSIRIEASRLDRLLDLLAELVMLRNRREARVSRFKDLYHELQGCVQRLRSARSALLTNSATAAGWAGRAPDGRSGPVAAGLATGENVCPTAWIASRQDALLAPLDEVTSDVTALAGELRELTEPISEDNHCVSRLIGQFRREFMELRRVPVAGLFLRLQRAARDAARAEGKQVRVAFVGESTGLERGLQERAYEPLLHLVRNAVSHGIEPPDERTARGKPAAGQVTLAAHADSSSLVLEVADDGRGLDYQALESRGRELGLLSPCETPSRERLSQLIFARGFSTRREASATAGRGVGMDAVTATVEALRGQVEIESEPERGMRVRLRIPLSSGIEHVVAFRADGQLFAVPIHYVKAICDRQAEDAEDRRPGSDPQAGNGARAHAAVLTSLREVLWLGGTARPQREAVLVLSDSRWTCRAPATGGPAREGEPGSPGESQSGDGVALCVDAIVGPEEVVVRPLPHLLRTSPVVSGVTLSGAGEIVLLLDAPRLIELALHGREVHGEGPAEGAPPQPQTQTRVLVVDDSRSARRAIVRALAPRGIAVDEACDGVEALHLLRSRSYAAVLSDVEMPRLGGLELLSEIKRFAPPTRLPVILITSRTDEPLRKRAAELGADAHLAKPLRGETLCEVLAACGVMGGVGEREMKDAG